MPLKRYLTLAMILLLAAVSVAACGPNRVNIALQYINALNNQEVDAVSAYVCDERANEITNALMTVTDADAASFAFENVSCAARGRDVLCRYTIRQDIGDTVETVSRDVVFSFEGDRICGFEQTGVE